MDSMENLTETYQRVSVSLGRVSEILDNKLYQDVKFGTKKLKDIKGVIEFKNVSFAYPKEKNTLKNFNLLLEPNKKIAILGRSGQGKSTLFKLVSQITTPTEGCIKIKGRVASLLEVGTGFHPELTGRENIYLNGSVLGMSRKEIDSKIDSIIEFSECEQFIDTPVKRYSSGMYVKLAFAVSAHLDACHVVGNRQLIVCVVNRCIHRVGIFFNRTFVEPLKPFHLKELLAERPVSLAMFQMVGVLPVFMTELVEGDM